MSRWNLITKEKQKQAYKGELKDYDDWKRYNGSIGDDLESFFIKIKNQEVEDEEVWSFFLPKLTNEELKLVAAKNVEHLESYFDYAVDDLNPDVDPEEMKKSDSKDKYVHCWCYRQTIQLTLDLNQSSPKSKISD